MSNNDPVAQAVLDRFEKSVQGRRDFDIVYNELRQLVRPEVAWFNSNPLHNTTSDISVNRNMLFDSTATWSADQLTSGLHSYVSSPVELFFTLGLAGIPRKDLPFSVLAWLDAVTSTIYSHFTTPSSNFHTAIHEVYADLSVFGTAGLYQWIDRATNTLRFRSFPLAALYLQEDSEGVVDTVHRTILYTVRQLRQEWPDAVANDKQLSKKEDNEKVLVIHEVCPRRDRKPGVDATSKPWASTYICKETVSVLSQSGYDWMPYMTPRWTKMPGELYGRGPGVGALPEIRMANAMSRSQIRAAQKLVDPPLIAEDDSILLPLRTHPGGLNFQRPGTQELRPIPTGQRIDITDQMLEQRRDSIRRSFYVDWLVRPVKKERQTAQEIMDDRQQMLTLLSPAVGRIQSELLGPCIQYSYNLLLRDGLLPDPPLDLGGEKLQVIYISPAARAQQLALSQGMLTYVQQISQLLPVMPDLIHTINPQRFAAELAEVTSAPRSILEDPETAQARADAAREAQQQRDAAESAPGMAKAARDYAQAKELDPSLGTMVP